MSNPNIIIIADYGTGDPSFTEVSLQLRFLIPNAYIISQSTPPFSTINTGFWIYQIALTSNPKNTYIFSNTSPRRHEKNPQKNNSGEKLMYARLNNGFEIVAVNSGYAFSFVKNKISKFNYVNTQNQGSQFRSRDFYPKAVAQMVKKDKEFIGEKADTNIIPDHPKNVICSIDGYGNIKTSIKKSQVKYKPGENIAIEIHNQKHLATYTDSVFNIIDGELAFAPGSSGHNDPFMEIFVRGGNAYKLFDNPNVEENFSIIQTLEK